MEHRSAARTWTAVVLLALAPCAVQAQTSRPQRIVGHPNLNGIWQAFNTAYWDLEAHTAASLRGFWQLGAFGAIPAGAGVVTQGKIPYLPAALKQRNENRRHWPEADPAAKCYMPGIPRAMYQPFPFQIFEGADPDILMVYSFHMTTRIIHMKDQIEPPVNTWMGRSNGHWENDTLVIDTHGFNGRTWLDRSGNFLSSSAHVTERIKLTDPEHIAYKVTMRDPKNFSRPWSIEMMLYRNTNPRAQLLEYKCVPFTDQLLYHDLLTGKESARASESPSASRSAKSQ